MLGNELPELQVAPFSVDELCCSLARPGAPVLAGEVCCGLLRVLLSGSKHLEASVVPPPVAPHVAPSTLQRLPPSADLMPDGTIKLTLGDHDADDATTYTPTTLLTALAKRNRLFGFTKGNGWQAVTYAGRRLAEWRADGGAGRV